MASSPAVLRASRLYQWSLKSSAQFLGSPQLRQNLGPFLGLWTCSELEVACWSIGLVCWLGRVLL
ncbi:acyl-CoA thioesterase 2 [Homo sapiens]|uniref:Acyl-CoA thioesterase 2 n=1 Tax=Homo sapiens TaxID=9606 RepID=F6VI00_HUMAN|nr:acyl-CoA thioesterase 2 [Homo sapiens]KAI4061549.1 acyl-CoA thioesterase 2 [Homo sapiens]